VSDGLPLQSTPVNPTDITIDSDFLPMVKEVRHAAAQSVPPVAAGGTDCSKLGHSALSMCCSNTTLPLSAHTMTSCDSGMTLLPVPAQNDSLCVGLSTHCALAANSVWPAVMRAQHH
jgi:hypothetical protein